MNDTHIPFVQSGSYPVREGNVVRPLIDGEPAFRRICETIEEARASVWLTVTFMWPSFEMPDGRGSALDVLDRASTRGVDVRILFWRPGEEMERWRRNAFWGSAEHIKQLTSRRSGVKIRWDRAATGFCQHQKCWLIDGEVAFVGGINLNPHSMVAPGHSGEGHNHDAYVEVAGPAAADVHHNFVQRWNEASERLLEDGRWGVGSEQDLTISGRVLDVRGEATVQIQRTDHLGERTIYDQYCAAIEAAQRSIYIENQYITVLPIVEGLLRAARRGVEIVIVIPSEPDGFARYVGEDLEAFFSCWDELGRCENCTLVGLAGVGTDGLRKPVYVHAKLMLIDDAWATVGSANLHRFSLFGNSEMNATFWCPDTVRGFRCQLLSEHLGLDTSEVDDRSALQRFREVAGENRRRFDVGDPSWQGLAFALDSATYCR